MVSFTLTLAPLRPPCVRQGNLRGTARNLRLQVVEEMVVEELVVKELVVEELVVEELVGD